MSRGGPLLDCLLLAARFHGRTFSPDALLAGLPTEGGVLTPSHFSRAAEKAGFTSRFAKGPINKLNRMLCPAVLILTEGRACLLLSMDAKGDSAKVLFPELGEGEADVNISELESNYTGIAIYLRPVFKFDERAPSYKKEKSHWFWSALTMHKGLYRDIIAASVLSNLFAFAMPLFTMNVYNRVVPNGATESLWVMAIGVFIMITGDFALNLARGYLTDLAAAKTNARLSAEMMQQVLGIRMEERPSSVGSLLGSVQGFDSVRSFISSATVFAYVDLPFAMFFFIVIGTIAWQLAVPLAVGALLILAQAFVVQNQMRDLSETTNRANTMKNSTLLESLVAIETVKTQGAEGQMQSRWEKTVGFLEQTNVQLRYLSSSISHWTQWIQTTASIATMIVGVYLIINQSISMGSLIAVSMLSGRAMAPIAKVTGLLMQYYATSRSLAALDDTMKKTTEHPDGATFISRPALLGEISFDKVDFVYPENETQALSSVSFRIKPGERVGFVGPIGSGKTTIAKLILGLYRPTGGTILLDGINILQTDPSELRRNIGSVSQDVMLFFGTLRENLLLGNPNATDAQLLEAAKISGVEAFAASHPKGFDMQIAERGMNLSLGQRQAVAVARAVLKNPPILLLDEPTSSMDVGSESSLCKKISQFVSGRTLLLVTHRTALLELVDRLIVIDGGRIVADGEKAKILESMRMKQIKRAQS